jgi:hypothetical protein
MDHERRAPPYVVYDRSKPFKLLQPTAPTPDHYWEAKRSGCKQLVFGLREHEMIHPAISTDHLLQRLLTMCSCVLYTIRLVDNYNFSLDDYAPITSSYTTFPSNRLRLESPRLVKRHSACRECDSPAAMLSGAGRFPEAV